MEIKRNSGASKEIREKSFSIHSLYSFILFFIFAFGLYFSVFTSLSVSVSVSVCVSLRDVALSGSARRTEAPHERGRGASQEPWPPLRDRLLQEHCALLALSSVSERTKYFSSCLFRPRFWFPFCISVFFSLCIYRRFGCGRTK